MLSLKTKRKSSQKRCKLPKYYLKQQDTEEKQWKKRKRKIRKSQRAINASLLLPFLYRKIYIKLENIFGKTFLFQTTTFSLEKNKSIC